MTVAIGITAMAAKSDPSSSTNGMTVIREGSTFKLFYKAPEQSNVTVKIYDESNKVIFSESFKESNGFIRPYNFEKLGEGSYTIELKDGNGTKTERIAYAEEKAPEKIAKIVQLPGTERYALLVPSNGAKSLSVEILNEDGISVYSKNQKVNGDYSKLFDLEGLESFTFVVSDSNGLSKTIRR